MPNLAATQQKVVNYVQNITILINAKDFAICLTKTAILRKNKKLRNKPLITKRLVISIRNKQKMYQTHF